MIAAILAAAAVQIIPAGCIHDAGQTLCWPKQILERLEGALPNVPPLQMNAEGRLVFAYPPCGTLEASKAPVCVGWVLDRANPKAIGYLPPLKLEPTR